MKRATLIAVFTLAFAMNGFSQQVIQASPAYDNIKLEKQAKRSKLPTDQGFVSKGEDNQPNDHLRKLMPFPPLSLGTYNNFSQPPSSGKPFQKGEYKFGLFLMHTGPSAKVAGKI